jgi:hypothetical protein
LVGEVAPFANVTFFMDGAKSIIEWKKTTSRGAVAYFYQLQRWWWIVIRFPMQLAIIVAS